MAGDVLSLPGPRPPTTEPPKDHDMGEMKHMDMGGDAPPPKAKP